MAKQDQKKNLHFDLGAKSPSSNVEGDSAYIQIEETNINTSQ